MVGELAVGMEMASRGASVCGRWCLLAIFMTTMLVWQPCATLPALGDMVSGWQLQVPVGRAAVDASWDRLADQHRVQQELYLMLRRMAVDAAETPDLPDDPMQAERARYLSTFMREPLLVVGAGADEVLEMSVAGVGVRLAGVSVSGMSRYSVEEVQVDLERHRFSYRLTFERLRIRGEYRLLHYWWAGIGRSDADGDVGTGQFDIGLRKLQVNGTGVLDVFANGTVVPAPGHTHTRTEYQEADIDVGRAEGAWGGVVSLLGAAAGTSLQLLAPYISQAVAPYTVEPIAEYLCRYGAVYVQHLDEQLRRRSSAAGDNSGSPLDAVDHLVHQLSQQLQHAGLDPLQLPRLQQKILAGQLALQLEAGALTGLSRLHRSGQLQLEPGRAAGGVLASLGTGRLAGRYRWTVSSGQYAALRRAGSIHFSIASVHVQVRLRLGGSGSLSAWDALASGTGVSVDDFDVHIGELTVESNGMGDTGVDRLLSMGAQGITRLVKDIVTKAIEAPITSLMKNQLQQLFTIK